MGIYITNIPNPIEINRLDSFIDNRGSQWLGCIVDPTLSGPVAYMCYRGDVPQPPITKMSRIAMASTGLWFRVPVSKYLRIKRYIQGTPVNPTNVRGMIFKDLNLYHANGRLVNPPSWSKELMTIVRPK